MKELKMRQLEMRELKMKKLEMEKLEMRKLVSDKSAMGGLPTDDVVITELAMGGLATREHATRGPVMKGPVMRGPATEGLAIGEPITRQPEISRSVTRQPEISRSITRHSEMGGLVTEGLADGAERWHKGIGDVFDAWRDGTAGLAYDENNIELDFMGDVEGVDVGVGGSYHAHDSSAVNGIGGIDEIGATCFDLDEDDAVGFHRHDINLHITGPPVALHYGVPLSNEQVDSQLFAPFSQIVMPCHSG